MRTLGLLAAAVAALTGCSGAGAHGTPRACETDDDCGVGWCVQSACVGDTEPRVQLEAPATVRANEPVTFSASVVDPDPGDAVGATQWTLAPVAGGCDPDVDERSPSALQAVFWCPGTYRIALAVVDARGGEGRAEATFDVVASPTAPSVTAPAALTLPHRCGGDPIACEALPSGSIIQLGAAAADPDGGPLSYAWRAIPPAAAAAATASFEPGPTAASPAVRITSPGTALAGAWRFRVRVTDGEGLVAQAYQTVTVENREPQVAGTRVEAPHRYDGGRYVAAATLAPTWSDPDGDPVTLAFAYEEPLATACTASVTAGGASGALVLSCADPSFVAPGVERAVHVSAVDVNGAGADAAFVVTVGNRLPEIGLVAGATDPMVLPHTVGPCDAGSCFVMEGSSPFTATDPDGDPLTPIAFDVSLDPTALRSWTSVSLGADGTPRFELGTPVDAPNEFRSVFSLVARAADPWQEVSRSLFVTSANQAPIAKSVPGYAYVGHTYDAVAKAFVASIPAASFEDPDGDPLTLFASSVVDACQPQPTDPSTVVCRSPYDWQTASGEPLSTFVGQRTASVGAHDGFGASSALVTQSLSIGNSPPTITCVATVNTCTCVCRQRDPNTDECTLGSWTFQARAAAVAQVRDADGDPFGVLLPGGGMTMVLGAYDLVQTNLPGTYTNALSASDGVATATKSCTTTVGCTRTGNCASP